MARSQSLKRKAKPGKIAGCFTGGSQPWLRVEQRELTPCEKFAVHGMVKLDPLWASSSKSSSGEAQVDWKVLDDLVGNSYNLHCVNALVLAMMCHFPWMIPAAPDPPHH